MVYQATFTCRICGKPAEVAQTREEITGPALEHLQFTVRCPSCFVTEYHVWSQAVKKKAYPAKK
jgi:hypothetical protein